MIIYPEEVDRERNPRRLAEIPRQIVTVLVTAARREVERCSKSQTQ